MGKASILSLTVGDLVVEPNSFIVLSPPYTTLPIVWQIAAINHPGYPPNTVTLIAYRALRWMMFDGYEYSNPDVYRAGGNNNYALSNIRQWLTSDHTDTGTSQLWWMPTHDYDAAPNFPASTATERPYASDHRLWHYFSRSFNGLIAPTQIETALHNNDGGGIIQTTDRVFLPSRAEVGVASLTYNSVPVEGTAYTLFTDNASRVCQPTPEAKLHSMGFQSAANADWRLRSVAAFTGSSATVTYITTIGSLDAFGKNATNGTAAIRPVLNIKNIAEIDDIPDINGVYTILPYKRPYIPTYMRPLIKA